MTKDGVRDFIAAEYTLSENYVHGLAAFAPRLKNIESPHSSRGSSPGLPAGNSVTEATLAKVGALDNVTPGDFAAVARQSKFAAAATAEDFHARLKADCELKAEKEARGHKIGF